jgi:hypothetical protein
MMPGPGPGDHPGPSGVVPGRMRPGGVGNRPGGGPGMGFFIAATVTRAGTPGRAAVTGITR